MIGMAGNIAQARSVKRELTASLRDAAEVNGIGLVRVDGGWAVKVNLAFPAPHLSVPRTVHGVPVQIDVVGPISAR